MDCMEGLLKEALHKKVTRRTVVRGLLLTGIGLSSGACTNLTPTPSSGEPTVPKPSATSAATEPVASTTTPSGPTRGGTLRFIQGTDPQDFRGVGTFTGDTSYLHQIYDTLVRVKPDGTPVPELAETWEWNDDGTELTFTLRAGARFHTGREITSEDVKFSLERFLDPAVGSGISTLLTPIIRCDTPDSRTVVFGMERPYPGIFEALDFFNIQNKDVIDKAPAEGAGSGPFKLAEWRPNEFFRLVRNDDYWREGLPYLDEIIVYTVPDVEAQVAMLKTGNADVINWLPGRSVSSFDGSPDIEIHRFALGGVVNYWMLNVEREPFNNKLVRQAMSYAIDRERIVQIALPGGEGVPACLPWPPTLWAHDEELAGRCVFDLNKAKEMLTQAGYPDGFATSVNTAVPSYSLGSMETAQILQEDLKKIGVTLEIKLFEAAEARNRLLESNFDSILHQYSRGARDPSSYLPSRTWGGSDAGAWGRFNPPEWQQLVEDARSTIDQEERKKLYRKVAEYAQEEAFVIPVAYRQILFAVHKRVQGMDADLDGFPRLDQVWLQQ